MVAFTEHFDPLTVALREFAPVASRLEPHLEAAIAQAVTEPGKLVRARLAHAAGRAHGLGEVEALQLACAVEYFHTASLLLDDLPCMDDAELRRGLPCVHRVHGEATAILAALALINRGYALAGFAFALENPLVRLQAIACVDACLGPAGLVGGQAADLRFSEQGGGARAVARIAAAKTGALFWLAVYLPALAGEPGEQERRALKALCVHWGLAFQALDDLADLARGEAETGKSGGRDRALERPNLVLALGAPGARARVARLARLASAALGRLEASSPRWAYLRVFQTEVFESVRRRVLGEAEALAAA
jgi:geranylgeranyl diphosphate synthase type II